MKTQEELNTIKEEVETLNKKLVELTEDELKQVVGGNEKYIIKPGRDIRIMVGPEEAENSEDMKGRIIGREGRNAK